MSLSPHLQNSNTQTRAELLTLCFETLGWFDFVNPWSTRHPIFFLHFALNVELLQSSKSSFSALSPCYFIDSMNIVAFFVVSWLVWQWVPAKVDVGSGGDWAVAKWEWSGQLEFEFKLEKIVWNSGGKKLWAKTGGKTSQLKGWHCGGSSRVQRKKCRYFGWCMQIMQFASTSVWRACLVVRTSSRWEGGGGL